MSSPWQPITYIPVSCDVVARLPKSVSSPLWLTIVSSNLNLKETPKLQENTLRKRIKLCLDVSLVFDFLFPSCRVQCLTKVRAAGLDWS